MCGMLLAGARAAHWVLVIVLCDPTLAVPRPFRSSRSPAPAPDRPAALLPTGCLRLLLPALSSRALIPTLSSRLWSDGHPSPFAARGVVEGIQHVREVIVKAESGQPPPATRFSCSAVCLSRPACDLASCARRPRCHQQACREGQEAFRCRTPKLCPAPAPTWARSARESSPSGAGRGATSFPPPPLPLGTPPLCELGWLFQPRAYKQRACP